MKKATVLLTGTTLIIFACTKSASVSSTTFTEDCSTQKTYAADVAPIISSSCAANSSCHGAGSNNGPGEFLTYAEVYNSRSEIRATVANGTMPRGSSLTNAQKNAILCWIDNGAANN